MFGQGFDLTDRVGQEGPRYRLPAHVLVGLHLQPFPPTPLHAPIVLDEGLSHFR